MKIAEQLVDSSFSAFRAQRQPHSIYHDRTETPFFAAGMEQFAVRSDGRVIQELAKSVEDV